MGSLIAAVAHALAAGDPLRASKFVALREVALLADGGVWSNSALALGSSQRRPRRPHRPGAGGFG